MGFAAFLKKIGGFLGAIGAVGAALKCVGQNTNEKLNTVVNTLVCVGGILVAVGAFLKWVGDYHEPPPKIGDLINKQQDTNDKLNHGVR